MDLTGAPYLCTVHFIQLFNLMSAIFVSVNFSGESGEIDQRKTFVGFLGLFSLHVQLFRQIDKKFIKQIWEVHRKVISLL